jgi:hypothetical protein
MSFYPTNMNDEAFVRGPGRVLYASMSQAFPTQISDVINLSTFNAQAGWNDIGATKGGIQISFNNGEEGFDVDQILAEIQSLPTSSEMYVQTQIGQATLDWLSFAWEGDAVTTNVAPTVPEKQTGVGPFESYTQRRLAVAFRRASTGKIRLHAFRKAQRAPQESTITYNKTGEQQSIPVRWRILPDTSVTNVRSRFSTMFDQQ